MRSWPACRRWRRRPAARRHAATTTPSRMDACLQRLFRCRTAGFWHAARACARLAGISYFSYLLIHFLHHRQDPPCPAAHPNSSLKPRRTMHSRPVPSTCPAAATRFRPSSTTPNSTACSAMASCKHFADGDTLFKAGNSSFGMLVILSGRVAVTRHEVMGQDTLLREVGPGPLHRRSGAIVGPPHPGQRLRRRRRGAARHQLGIAARADRGRSRNGRAHRARA